MPQVFLCISVQFWKIWKSMQGLVCACTSTPNGVETGVLSKDDHDWWNSWQ